MRVLVTGGTGFIGSALIERLLLRNDIVTALTRRVRDGATPGVRWVEWDPDHDGDWQRALAEQDAVVHLAGETAAGRRYTPEVEQRILESRVGSTTRVVDGIAKLPPEARPKVLVCASGVGYYGNLDDDRPLDESAPPGDDFLARVCVAWEGAAREAERSGVRVVSTRIGFVLGNGGGALSRLVPIFKSFVGGPLGSGKQMVSWIHLADTVGAMLHALDDTGVRGPMNVAAPNAVTNAELSKTLGHVLKRPSILSAPAFALKALFGDGAEPLLGGQRAVPRVLLEQGYRFRFTELEAALRDLLG